MANARLGLNSRTILLDQHDSYDTEHIEAREREYAPRIGGFFIAFSELENTLDSSISAIINERSDDIGLQVISVMDYSQKVAVFQNTHLYTAYHMAPEQMEGVKKLGSKLRVASELRNIIAHANWNTLTEDGYVRSGIKADKEMGATEFLYYELTPEILDTKIKEIGELDTELYKVVEGIMEL